MSRLLKIIGLFSTRALEKRRYSAKETYNFKEPTTCSHPIHATVAKTRRHGTPWVVTRRVLQCVAERCSVLQCVAVRCIALQQSPARRHDTSTCRDRQCVAVCSVLQCVAVWCSVVQWLAAWCSVLQCVATVANKSTTRIGSCVAVCCSVLQCVTA